MSSSAVRYVPRNQRKRSRRLDEQPQPQPHQQPPPPNMAAVFSDLRYNEDDDANDDGETSQLRVALLASSAKEQRPEDFMDDQDHNEWGGPVRVKQHFGGGSGSNSTTAGKQSAAIADSSNILDSIFGGDDNNDKKKDDQRHDVNPKDANIGSRLLHRLGWRGQGVSFVPNDDEHSHSHSAARNNNDNDNGNNNNNLEEEQIFLSQRRLRKIRVQQERVRIPPPKTDHAGLGYQALDNAPEFRAHREQRQRLALARQQQQQGISGGGASNNVYRLSNLLVDKNNNTNNNMTSLKPPPPPPGTAASGSDGNGNQHQNDHLSMSYETIQDFVGTKSVSGFALRDDDDDAVFDDPVAPTGAQAQQGVGEEALDTVAYEHTLSDVEEEDDDDDGGGNLIRNREAQALGGALDAFANLDDDDDKKEQGVEKESVSHHSSSLAIGHLGKQTSHASLLRTADGRPPLPGFVIGTHGQQQLHFYRGPDVPELYEVKPHEFHPNDHPLVYQALSRAMQLEAQDVRQAAATRAALESNAAAVVQKTKSGSSSTTTSTATSKHPASIQPMAGSAFTGLQEAMKNRFVSSSASSPKANNEHAGTTTVNTATAGESVCGLVTHHAALTWGKNPEQQQQQQAALSNSTPASELAKKPLIVKRTIMSFVPEPLVCKRFHISPLPQSAFGRQQQKQRQQGAEDAYFHDSILKTAQERRQIVVKGSAKVEEKPYDKEEDAFVIHHPARPSMQIYKSIFAPESESSEESEDEFDPVKADNNDDEKNEETQLAAAGNVREKNVLNDPSFGKEESKDIHALVVASHGESSSPRKRTRSSDSSNLSSSSPDESDKNSDDGGEKRRRRDKKSSHRKRHGKSYDEKKKRKHSRKRKDTDSRRLSRKRRFHSDDDDEAFDSKDKQEDSDDHRRRRKDSKRKSRRKEGKGKSSRRESSSSPHPSEKRHRDRA